MEDEEEHVRNELSSRSYLLIAKGDPFLLDNIDSLVTLSRENTSIESLELFPFDSDAGNYEFWDKVGQIVGNLKGLSFIKLHFLPFDKSVDNDDDIDDDNGNDNDSDTDEDEDNDSDGDEVPSPDWETLTRILRCLRCKVELCSDCDAEVEEVQGLARAIHGHPMISAFSSRRDCTFENLGPWCYALATLPSLGRVRLSLREPAAGDQDVVVKPADPLTNLLRAPALHFVNFDDFYFTDAHCHAIARALERGSSITSITFGSNCSFPDWGMAIIVNALKTNATVTDVHIFGDFDDTFFNALAAALLSNSTLQNLTVHVTTVASAKWISSIFLSLGMNTTLKSLFVVVCDDFGDELCSAITSGLAMNSTLEDLFLLVMIPSDDDGAVSARNALNFLRTNCTLKSLKIDFQAHNESFVTAFRLEAVKMIAENPFLESFTVSAARNMIKFEDLFAFVSVLQSDTTLKTLACQIFYKRLSLTNDEVDQLVTILMKNYGLESLVPEISCEDDGTVKAILRLNRAGRRYLIKDGSSISKGVEVLSAVNDDINCVFFHMLENPGLCSRRAAETTTTSRRLGANLDKSSSTGKREQAQSQTGKEHRRRLA
jgi:hypothetical protein